MNCLITEGIMTLFGEQPLPSPESDDKWSDVSGVLQSGKNSPLQWSYVQSVAPICSGINSNMFSKPSLMHSPRHRPIQRKDYPVIFLGPR